MGRDHSSALEGAFSDEFQSTRPHGARHIWLTKKEYSRLFQSTRPHGARHKPTYVNSSIFSFNPRARMGRDLDSNGECEQAQVSIHAPAWGATLW